MPLPLTLPLLAPPVQFAAPLDTPMWLETGLSADAFRRCPHVEAVRPDGSPALMRPPTTRGAESQDQSLLQDRVVVDTPGTWTVRVRRDCEDDAPWTAVSVRVTAVEDDVHAWSKVNRRANVLGLERYRRRLTNLAAQGDPWSVDALGEVPTPEATDTLIGLLAHPHPEISNAAFRAVAMRIPLQDRTRSPAWSAATWRPTHVRALDEVVAQHPDHPIVAVWTAGGWTIDKALDHPDHDRAWRALLFHREVRLSGDAPTWSVAALRLKQALDAEPLNAAVLDLLRAGLEGRESSVDAVLQGLEHPIRAARDIAAAAPSPCTPALATRLLGAAKAGDVSLDRPGRCPTPELAVHLSRYEAPAPADAMLDYLAARVEGDSEARARLLENGTFAVGTRCPEPPTAAEAEAWQSWRAEPLERRRARLAPNDLEAVLPPTCERPPERPVR